MLGLYDYRWAHYLRTFATGLRFLFVFQNALRIETLVPPFSAQIQLSFSQQMIYI